MWEVFSEIEIKSTPDKMWAVLKDVDNWPVWDTDLESAKLDAPTENLEGATGAVTMKGGTTFKFKLHNINPTNYVAYVTELPGSSADWYWEYKKFNEAEGTLGLKMGVKFTGLANGLYWFLLKSRCASAMEVCTKNLKSLLETGKV
ncbi:hypothetical protein HK098_002144 [Nowakowskiella sp. JEL0407]|nr:hypothetical protein HK098_002144 [Nowakowskiella sp. JEL0407]